MGGAGSGKSLTATNIRAQLGFKGYDIELVDEVIKDWTYIPRIPKMCDSFYLQASQIQKEDIRLRAGVNLIVSDSPLMLQYFYAKWHNVPLQAPMLQAALEFEEIYPSIHIFIEREDDFYSEIGRYETLAEAKAIDAAIKETMTQNNISFVSISCLSQDEIIDYIVSKTEE
jgi:hypothetical protein